MTTFDSIFTGMTKPIVIGMIHLAPLEGYPEYPGFDAVRSKFDLDLNSLLAGGVDAIMLENNYDIPHYEKALASTIPLLDQFCAMIREKTDKPLGLSVLWNDYHTALTLAHKNHLQFIRIPVFVDRVQTEYGVFEPQAEATVSLRKEIGADDVLIMADIQVKHAKHLIERPITEAAREAAQKGADALIVTGRWTGDPPTTQDVLDVRNAGGLPVVLGSGITAENGKGYGADAIIVSTYFKGEKAKGEHTQNIFPWQIPYEIERIKQFMQAVK